MYKIKKWLPLIVVSTALGIVTMDMTITNVSLDAIITDLNTDLRTFQWIVTGYSLVLAAFTITGGRLGDMFGRKKLFLTGAVLFGLGSLLAAVAYNAGTMLLGLGLIEGLGAACMLPATGALILSTYQQKKERAIAFGVYAGVAGVAASIGPLLGGYLTTNYSWRWAYLINPAIVVLLLFGARMLKESRETEYKPHLDGISVTLSSLGLAGVVFGIIESSAYGWFREKSPLEVLGHSFSLGSISAAFWGLAVGLLLLVVFVWRQKVLERQKKMPLVSLKLMTNRQFMAGASTGLVLTAAQFGIIFVLFVFWQVARGYNAFHAGLAGIALPLSILVGAPLGGVVTGVFKFRPKRVIQAGILLSLIGILWFHFVAATTTTAWQLTPALIFFGLGFGLSLSPIANLTLSAVSVQEGGEASGVNNTFREVGSSLGQALLGAILIASLSSSMLASLQASRTLPTQVKTAAAQTLQDGSAQDPKTRAEVAKLPPRIQHELEDDQQAAAAQGVRDSLLVGAGLAVLSLISTLFLPLTMHRAHPEVAIP